MRLLFLTITLALSAAALQARASNSVWSVTGSPEAPPLRLIATNPIGPGTAWVFECRKDDVAITEVGVTQLLDVNSGKRVGDEPGSRMTPGAAQMALAVGSTATPAFQPATAQANPTKGWDLTIEVAKSDSGFRSLAGADAISLFTTGMTGLAETSEADRKLIGGFVDSCIHG